MNHETGFVTIPDRWCKRVNVAFEETRAMHDGRELFNLLQSAINELDEYVSEMLDVFAAYETSPLYPTVTTVEVSEDTYYFSSEKPARLEIGAKVETFWPYDNRIML